MSEPKCRACGTPLEHVRIKRSDGTYSKGFYMCPRHGKTAFNEDGELIGYVYRKLLKRRNERLVKYV